MALTFRPRHRLTCLALSLVFSSHSFALGLSAASGQAVLGEPLRISIPLLGVTEGPPATDCFRIAAPEAPMDADYVLRDGRVRVESSQGQTRLIVVSSRPWHQPVVEFRIVASCHGADLARDYLLLVSLPAVPSVPSTLAPAARELAAPTASAAAPTANVVSASIAVAPKHAATPNAAPPAPNPAAPAPNPAASSPAAGDTLRLSAATNLNALAREHYPNNREARDEYRRLMAQANPALLMGKGAWGGIPLAAGTVLVVPANLPKPDTEVVREKSAQPAAKDVPAPKQAPAAPAPVASAKTAPPAVSTKPTDRLVIGGDSSVRIKPLSPREVASAMDRLERMLEDQGRTQQGMTESLKSLDLAFADVRKLLLGFDERMKQLEVERARAEAARAKAMALLEEERSKFGVVQMLLVVLASGLIGAGLLHFHHRLQLRRMAPHGGSSIRPLPVTDDRDEGSVGSGENLAAGEFDDNEFVAPSPRAAAPGPAPVHIPTPIPVPVSAPSLSPAVTATPVPALVIPAAAITVLPPVVQKIPVSRLPTPVTMEPPSMAPVIDTIVAPQQPAPVVEAPQSPMIEFEFDLHPPGAVPLAPTFSPPVDAATITTPTAFERAVTETHSDPTLELAALMESMGLARGAAQTLIDHIRANPRGALGHWLKLIEINQRAGLQNDFGASLDELRVKFNVAIDETGSPSVSASLADYPHLSGELVAHWQKPECGEFLTQLIEDTREGTRAGFPHAVAEEILLLTAMNQDILASAV